jgi:hypothetical protein
MSMIMPGRWTTPTTADHELRPTSGTPQGVRRLLVCDSRKLFRPMVRNTRRHPTVDDCSARPIRLPIDFGRLRGSSRRIEDLSAGVVLRPPEGGGVCWLRAWGWIVHLIAQFSEHANCFIRRVAH